MLMPSIFGDSFMDDFFDFPEVRPARTYQRTYHQNQLMKTDIFQTKDGYEIIMDLPGYKKEDVTAELKDGYLVITASTNQNNDEKDAEGKYLRRERYSGSCSRSFYVGDDLTQEDIKAKFEHGTLKLMVPNKENRPKVEETRHITIEG